ncbi:MAG TPA: amino acid adenylation domain-containing protein, partial [Candidatus Deferrimicrobium sp.]|nr:amino acid adenylation domain-containing protein [Candidatus Deferrimicrobium sp.]
KSAVENKNQRICDLEILSESEKKRILSDFNDTVREYPKDKTIEQLVAGQVENSPDRIALVGAVGPVHLTYRRLNERAGGLAGLLINKGVLADHIVGIMMERSIEMIIGMLGILKSGGAYLPIDPAYPRERIDYMLKDSAAKLLVTTNNKEGEKVGRWEGEKILLEFIIHHPKHLSLHHSSFIIHHSSRLAYIIYTSGSTGNPKGVMVEHHHVGRLVKNAGYINFSSYDRLLPTGSAAFDITTFEIWGPLCNGAGLMLVDKETLLNTEKLKEILFKQDITVLHLIPQLFNQLAVRDMELFAGLRYFLVGGDQVSPVYINRLRQKYPHLKILHMYGPTENTTFSTFFPVAHDYEFNIPIGKPVANTTAYIVDSYGHLQPVGVMGQLYVGGAGVARGYLNNPELTSAKFINLEHAKLYCTGDLARWLADGNIEFLGRIDTQVKIRGYRVELGEIENCLLNYPGLEEAVVLAQEESSGEKYLAAYMVADKEYGVSELRDYLAKELPDYMVPAYFVQLEKMPLTPNGKIDRKALPEPGLENGVSYMGPGNAIEKKLVELWVEILGKDETSLGIDDNFFHRGGHSLKAAKLMARIHRVFNVKISLGELFKAPTIRAIASAVAQSQENRFSDIKKAEKKDFYELSFNQKRLWFIQQMNPASWAYHMPGKIILNHPVEDEWIEKTLSQLARRHESLQT